MGRKLLTGKSARIIVTMGMPTLLYRVVFRSHSLKNLERILHFVGIQPVRATLFGSVEGVSDAKGRQWIESVRLLGNRGR